MFISLGVYLLSLAALIAPAFALFSGNLLTPLLAASSMIPLIYCIKDKTLRTSLLSPHSFFLLLLLVLGVLSSTWSIMPEQSWKLGLRLIALCTLGYSCIAFTSLYATHSITRFVTLGNVLALILIMIELKTNGFISTFLHKHHTYQLSDLNKGSTFIALSSWATLQWLMNKKRWALTALFWASVLVILLQLESLAAILAFMVMTAIFAFLRLFPNKGFYSVLPILLVGLAITPVVLHTVKPEAVLERVPNIPLSALHRLYIWEYASHKADERPVLGWGLSGTRYIEVKPEDIRNPLYYPMPVHPHNQMMQLRFDLGLPGMALFIMFVGSLMYAIHRSSLSPEAKATIMAGIVGYLIIGGLGYSVWHNWWISNGFLVAMFFASTIRSKTVSS